MTRHPPEERFDLVVIGGGAGGLSVASVAGRLGLRVALVEASGALGGECLHTGCVPSKTLLRSAHIAQLMRRGADFGLTPCNPTGDMAAISQRVQTVIQRLQAHDDPGRFQAYGVEVIFATARFLDPRRVQAGERLLRGRRFVLATGSQPVIPAIPGLTEAGYWTNEALFTVTESPKRLVVLGGGPVGVEMAQAFNRLGWTVTLLERQTQLLPSDDPEAAAQLAATLRAEGLTLCLGTEAVRVTPQAGKAGGHCLALNDGASLETDRILVATGRRPVTEELDLERAGVGYNPRWGIRTDTRQRTSARHIYAVGDACGPFYFSHAASYQAGVVIRNAVFRLPAHSNYTALPRVTYTDPEVAQVGPTPLEAQARYSGVAIHRADFGDLDRALAEGEETGFAKLALRRNRIVGATVVGSRAGELLPELVQAVAGKLRPRDIVGAVHAYPTLAEINKRVMERYYAQRLFRPSVRAAVRWLNRLLP